MTECPLPCEMVTFFPGDGRPRPSWSVTVMVVVVTPSEGTGVGDALIDALVANGGMNRTVGCACSTMLPGVTVAVNVTDSNARSVTLKTTAPLSTVDTPLAGVITAWLPGLAASTTV